MRCRGSQFWSILGLACGLALAGATARAQDGARSLTGQIVSGYSGISSNGQEVKDPYVGFVADMKGWWRDPRVLNYDLGGNFAHGFQYAGPMAGPDSNGMNANGTFLGGSRMPLSFYYSRQYIPTPDFSLAPYTVDFGGSSRVRQFYGFDWVTHLNRLPAVDFHYRDSSDDNHYPSYLGGDTQNNDRDFRVNAQYTLAKWQLGANFGDTWSKADTPGFFSTTGQNIHNQSDSLTYGLSASRALPMRSQMALTWASTDSNVDLGTYNTTANYQRAQGIMSSQWTDRLSTNLQASYISSASSYALQQILLPGSGGSIGQFPFGLLNTDSGLLSYSGGASFLVFQGVQLHGSVGQTSVLSSSNSTVADTTTESAGVSIAERLYGGQFAAGYDATHWNMAQVGTADDTWTHSVSASYSRPTLWGIQAGVRGNYLTQHLDYVTASDLDSYGFAIDLSRKVGEWNVRGTMDYRWQNVAFTTRNNYAYKTFSVTAQNKRMQFNLLKTFDNSLAYQFGNSVILTPTAPAIGPVPGLPMLVDTSGGYMAVSGSYNISRRWTVRGSWLQGTRSISVDHTVNSRGFDARTEYHFRKVHLAGGYDRTWQVFQMLGTQPYRNSYFYFELRRDFRLF